MKKILKEFLRKLLDFFLKKIGNKLPKKIQNKKYRWIFEATVGNFWKILKIPERILQTASV